MPLPVEKSAGKVSSLVARWQTAADIEQQQAARRESSSRRSSINSLGRRSSDNFSVKPSPKVEGGEALPNVEGQEEAVEMLDDEEGEEVPKSAEKVKTKDEMDMAAKPKVDDDPMGRSPDKVEEKSTDGPVAQVESGSKARHNTDISQAPVVAASTTSAVNGHSAQAKANTTSTASSRSPPGAQKATLASVSRIPSSTSKPTATARKPSSGAARPVTRTTTAPAAKTSGSVRPSTTTNSTARPASSSASKIAPRTSAVGGPSSTTSIRKPSSTLTASSSQPVSKPSLSSSNSAKTVGKPAIDSKPRASGASRPPPSSFASSSVTRVKPNTSQSNGAGVPVRRPSSAVPSAANRQPAPLRPQVTGTPAKPTASSLAKAREAAEKRQSISLGRASGTAAKQRLSLAPQLTGHGKSASAPSASTSNGPSGKPSGTATSSRLLQGTASSRAKAAEPQSPRSPKTSTAPRETLTARVKLAEKGTPTRPSASKIDRTPVSPTAPKTPTTPRSPIALTNKAGGGSMRAPLSPSTTKASPGIQSSSVEKQMDKAPESEPTSVSTGPAPVPPQSNEDTGSTEPTHDNIVTTTSGVANEPAIPRSPTPISDTTQTPVTPGSAPSDPPQEPTPVTAVGKDHETPPTSTSPATVKSSQLEQATDTDARRPESPPSPPTRGSPTGAGNTAASTTDATPQPTSLIGRVGLAAAREALKEVEAIGAKSPSEPVAPPSKADRSAPPEDSSELHDEEPAVIPKETEQVTPTKGLSTTNDPSTKPATDPTASSEEVEQAGQVEEPEAPRSASGPTGEADSKAKPDGAAVNPSGPFGRIGHPGATSKHELESPNTSNTSTTPSKREGQADIQWNEDELRRDPAKTIVSPDVKKTPNKSDSA